MSTFLAYPSILLDFTGDAMGSECKVPLTRHKFYIDKCVRMFPSQDINLTLINACVKKYIFHAQ